MLGAEIQDLAEPRIELRTGTWLRHPLLGAASPYQVVLDSWRGAFSYVEEDQDHDIIGLRPPQIGAVHAVHSHWTDVNALFQHANVIVITSNIAGQCLPEVRQAMAALRSHLFIDEASYGGAYVERLQGAVLREAGSAIHGNAV